MRRGALVVAMVFAALAAGALGGGEARGAVVLGIADQKAETFSDPRLHALGMRRARIAVSWDVLEIGYERERLDRWLAAALGRGVEPLVSFQHSARQRRSLPSPVELTEQFLAFRKRYPQVTQFATWNEANHCGQPTCHREKLVAAYYRKLRQGCPKCTILAVELLDMPNMMGWMQRFRRYAKVEPKHWGLHNYVEANRFRSTRLRSLLRRVKGQVWLTEVGGLVRRRTKRKRYTVKRIPESPAHAKRVTDYLFKELLPSDRRLTRVYLYHWNSSSPADTWDSALIGPDGERRPAYWVLVRKMRSLQAARR